MIIRKLWNVANWCKSNAHGKYTNVALKSFFRARLGTLLTSFNHDRQGNSFSDYLSKSDWADIGLSKVSFALCETGKSMYVQRKVSFNVFMIHIPKKVCTTGNSTIWNNRTLPGQMHLKGVQKILFTSNLYGKQNRKRLMQLTRYRKLSVSFFSNTAFF